MTSKAFAGRFAIVIALTASLAAPMGATAGPNLVENPGFEQTVLPGPVKDAFLDNGLRNGVYPLGWRFEGATVLFDQTGQNPHGGTFAGAISGSLSGPRGDCSVNCVTVPGNAERNTVNGYASIAPAYVSAVPFAVTGGASYTFSFYVRTSILRDGSGAITKVRWYGGTGVPVAVTEGPSLMAGNDGATYANFITGNSAPFNVPPHTQGWTFKTKTVTAPAGSQFAAVYLGYSDDAWIGQVVYDDVFFG